MFVVLACKRIAIYCWDVLLIDRLYVVLHSVASIFVSSEEQPEQQQKVRQRNLLISYKSYWKPRIHHAWWLLTDNICGYCYFALYRLHQLHNTKKTRWNDRMRNNEKKLVTPSIQPQFHVCFDLPVQIWNMCLCSFVMCSAAIESYNCSALDTFACRYTFTDCQLACVRYHFASVSKQQWKNP